ncbi:hypothetical protein U27_00135 [Candidatus Vecturithrix granuli]|uniref:Uncharacterized protein n=1 Tax=Vecturithrix granuli TaxID=1499967 RepID=A0A081C6N9_VECG1|nr:hypothetical protein U27_00135 [Candidatus Vecturithrix granuli]
MKIFQTEAEHEDMNCPEEFQDKIDILENLLQEMRYIIGHRRTLLKNADKKLQEFQDTIYAMIMEEEYPKKRMMPSQDDDEKPETPSV